MAELKNIVDELTSKNQATLDLKQKSLELAMLLKAIGGLKQVLDGLGDHLGDIHKAQYTPGQEHRVRVINWRLAESVKTPDVAKLADGLADFSDNLVKAVNDKQFDLSVLLDLGDEVRKLTKKIPQKLPTPEVEVKVDLRNVEKLFAQTSKNLEVFQKALKTQPEIIVPSPDIKPFTDSIENVVRAVKSIPTPQFEVFKGGKPEVKNGALATFMANSFLPEEFDEIKIEYDEWRDSKIASIVKYKLRGKIVRRLKLQHNDNADLTGVRIL